MKTLFIDTHKSEMTVILRNDEEEIRISKSSDRSHSEVVMPAIEEVFKKSNLTVSDLDLIVVVNGPGSFTGVRIGVVIAKTMAYTKNIPIKSITSLEMYGVSSPEKGDIVTVCDPKGVYSARCENDKYVDMRYQKRDDFSEYVKEGGYSVIQSEIINLDKIISYLENRKPENPHTLNPIYIKEIDALK